MQRHFTHADITAYFERFKVRRERESEGRETLELKSINVLPELSPPCYRLSYLMTDEFLGPRWYTMLVAEFEGLADKTKPWLNIVGEDELPAGFTTPAEEDAEIARRKAEQRRAWEAESRSDASERTTPVGDTIFEL